MKNSLFHWQEECLKQWKLNRFKGIINVVTGAGKTVLAIAAVELLFETEAVQPLKVKIIVPKKFLIYQWYNALRDNLGIPPEDIGIYSGAYKTPSSRKFMIYVVNSARYTLSRHIVDDIKKGGSIFLIADECHHYGSEENSKIFGFVNHLPWGSVFYTLGLSATPYGKNYNEILVPALGDEIYSFNFFNALKADIINKFAVFNICVSFDGDEGSEYEYLSEKLGIALMRLKQHFPELRLSNGSEFFAILENIISSSEDALSELAKTVLLMSVRRKEVVYLAKSRINCVVDLVRLTHKSSKIIIFGERIETAEEIFMKLSAIYPNEVGIYHSKLAGNIGKNVLRQFENFEIRILVSCKTLDEGLNVSETDVGIVVSSTGSKRQRIQRLGRVLRKKRNNRIAYFYYLFVDNTTEEDTMLEEITDKRMSGLVNVLDLQYDQEEKTFVNHYYKTLTDNVVSGMRQKNYDNELINEFLRNIEKAVITTDWLIDEQLCLEKIKLAEGRAERNYYIAMVLIIRSSKINKK